MTKTTEKILSILRLIAHAPELDTTQTKVWLFYLSHEAERQEIGAAIVCSDVDFEEYVSSLPHSHRYLNAGIAAHGYMNILAGTKTPVIRIGPDTVMAMGNAHSIPRRGPEGFA